MTEKCLLNGFPYVTIPKENHKQFATKHIQIGRLDLLAGVKMSEGRVKDEWGSRRKDLIFNNILSALFLLSALRANVLYFLLL